MMNEPDPRLCDVLRSYADQPLAAGDAVLFLDRTVCMEIPGLADHWDEVLRRNTSHVLRETARDVVLAIARPGADLLPRTTDCGASCTRSCAAARSRSHP